jgi:purine-binding chemotaxis protein CheW
MAGPGDHKKQQAETHLGLMDPQRALTVYLDALLCEVAFPDAAPSANTEKPVQEAVVTEITPSVTEASPVVTHETATVAETASVPPTPTEAASEEDENPALVAHSPQQTDLWTEGQCQCMTFQVGGLTLAAPLEKLNGIVQWDDSITELPGYAPWLMGLLTTRGENVQVVDLAQIIIPPERRAGLADARERVNFVILMEQGNWGIAVDSLSQVITLTPDDVRWSGENRKRQWLAGMVKERMCALLELDHLHEELSAGLKAD